MGKFKQLFSFPVIQGKARSNRPHSAPAEQNILHMQTFLGTSFGIFHCLSYRKSWTNSFFPHLDRDICIFPNCVSQSLNYSDSWNRIFCHYYQWVNIATASCPSVLDKENILGVALLSMKPVWFVVFANFSSICPPYLFTEIVLLRHNLSFQLCFCVKAKVAMAESHLSCHLFK